MSKRKYLKNIEDIEALRNTDTKIYSVRCSSFYHKFINGILCFFTCEDKLLSYNTALEDLTEHYIEVEDEPSEDWIGKLGMFSNCYGFEGEVGVLERLVEEDRPYVSSSLYQYKYFRPLTPEEVEKYTGHKVVNNEIQASSLDNNKIQAKEV